MHHERLEENLLDELTRLVGRPVPVIAEALAGLLGVLVSEMPRDTMGSLSPFPMSAWQALAPQEKAVRRIWGQALTAGLTVEEVFTVIAVVDDHVRRRFGADAWPRVAEWGPRLAIEHDVVLPAADAAGVPLERPQINGL
ncbi:MAG: hypothetical protein JSV80_15475 [Acidobacteriota bacterium]|nr:MAG: hypothetical protein JSV80_15475 [Acidobacteriota bacterium]